MKRKLGTNESTAGMGGLVSTIITSLVTVVIIFGKKKVWPEEANNEMLWGALQTGLVGLLTLVSLRFLGPRSDKTQPTKRGPPTTFPVIVFLCVLSSGCAHTLPNPIEKAETPEQKAFALYGVWHAFHKLAIEIAEDETVDKSIRDEIIDMQATAYPVAESLFSMAMAARKARASVERGDAPPEVLKKALMELRLIYEQAFGPITKFIDLTQPQVAGGSS